MRKKIDYGIYLGLEYASMCRIERGVPVIKKCEVTDDSIPCCVFFNRRGGTVVGANAYRSMKCDMRSATKSWKMDASNAFVGFQRTMGTDKIYHSKNMEDKGLKADYTSEELSAEVLKALKSFITDGDFHSAVITIPAKFTEKQKDATRQAAKLAGFDHCELLQEPIAASMAYGISSNQNNCYWIVFDFGSEKFDASLLNIENGIMRILDTEGDNYLGGQNLDYAIVDDIILPYLKEYYAVDSILSDENRKEILRDAMKTYAEDLKNKLSFQDKEDIISNLGELGEDEDGEEIELDLTVTQEQAFNAMRPHFQKAVDICKTLLDRNGMRRDLCKILLVGNSTRLPLIRQMLREQITENVDTSIDPVTAVASGAAIYASTFDYEIIVDMEDNSSNSPDFTNDLIQPSDDIFKDDNVWDYSSNSNTIILPHYICTDKFFDDYLRVVPEIIPGLEKGASLPAIGELSPLKLEVDFRPDDEDDIRIPIFHVDSLYVGQYAWLCEKIADIIISGECFDFVIPKETQIDISIYVDSSERITAKVVLPELGRSIEPIVRYNTESSDSEYNGKIKYEIRYGYDKLNKMIKDGLEIGTLYTELESVDNDFDAIPIDEKKNALKRIKEVLRKIDKLDNETIFERRKNNIIKGIAKARELKEVLYTKYSVFSLSTIERDARDAFEKNDPKLIRKVLSQVEGYVFNQKERIKKDEALKQNSVLLNINVVEDSDRHKAFVYISVDKDSNYDQLNVKLSRKESKIYPMKWTSELKKISKIGGIIEVEMPSSYWNEYEILAYSESGSAISVYPSVIIIDKNNNLNNYEYGKN
jgi:actin-like ATPase involved in cell morphogenesis